MIKKAVISLVLLVLLVVGIAFFYLDSIVKSGIEVVGSEVLGTGVTVNSVSISPLNGSGSIRGLSVGNPAGFRSEHAIQLEELTVNLNVSSLFSDVIEIDSIRVVQPEITYETRITTDNIRALIANISAGSATGESAVEPAAAGKGLIIRDLQLLDPQLNLVAAIVTAPIPLPDIQMTDIGAENDSSSVAEVLQAVLSKVSTSILSANLPSLDDLAEGVEARLEEGREQVQDTVEDAVEELGGRLRSILN